jgi:CBS domain-containing protein
VTFRDDLKQDTVSSLQLREAIVIHPQTSVSEAVALMRTKSLGCAVIVDHDGTPRGFFTEQSLLVALLQHDSLEDRPVSDFVDPDFITVQSSEPISRVWEAVRSSGSRFICVTDDDGNLIGVTGQRGLAEYVAEYFPQQVSVQRLGSTPWMQNREGA